MHALMSAALQCVRKSCRQPIRLMFGFGGWHDGLDAVAPQQNRLTATRPPINQIILDSPRPTTAGPSNSPRPHQPATPHTARHHPKGHTDGGGGTGAAAIADKRTRATPTRPASKASVVRPAVVLKHTLDRCIDRSSAAGQAHRGVRQKMCRRMLALTIRSLHAFPQAPEDRRRRSRRRRQDLCGPHTLHQHAPRVIQPPGAAEPRRLERQAAPGPAPLGTRPHRR